MKKYFFLTLLLSINNYAQKNEDLKEVFPVFPICKLLSDDKQEQCFNESLQEHIEKYFFYPKTAWDLDLEALVKVKFDININGEIDNIDPAANIVGISFIEREAFTAAKQLFQLSAIQIIEKLPLFIPAKINGIPTKKTFQTSIVYRIPKELSFYKIENAPVVSGCEEKSGEESKTCFKDAISKHISEEFKYFVSFLPSKIWGFFDTSNNIDRIVYISEKEDWAINDIIAPSSSLTLEFIFFATNSITSS